MASRDIDVELFYNGAWNAVPAYARDPIVVARGANGEGQESPPNLAMVTLDNRTGAYNPQNPASALYGLVGRNTPLRISVDGSVRSMTEAASWRPERSLDGKDAWTVLEGGGVLRRLQQGKTPLRSPAVRGVLQEDPVAFWPLEDLDGATQAVSGLVGGTPLTLTGVAGWAKGQGLTGSPKVLDMTTTTGLLTAPVAGSGTGWGVEFGFRLPSAESSLASVANFMRVENTGTAPIWDFFPNADMNAVPMRSDESLVGGIAGTGASGLVFDGEWHHARLDVETNGSGVDATWYLDGVDMGTTNFASVTAGHVVRVSLNYTNYYATGGTPNYDDMPALGYLAVYDGTTPTTTFDAYMGYAGETAGERFERLGAEEGISTICEGTASDSQPMGPQPSATLVDLLRECVRTDSGLMYGGRNSTQTVMRVGRDLYNQDAALTLSFIAGQLAPGVAPVLDDQATRNDVTATARTGAFARAVKETGPLNVSDPTDDPEGVGRVDTSVQVNVDNEATQLLDQATWRLHLGTVAEPRYPTLTIDLDAYPTLATSVNALIPGDRITIDNMPADWSPDLVDLLVIGIREQLGTHRRLVTLVTAPYSPYEIGIVGQDDGSGALRGQAIDTDNSTLSGAHNSTTTSLTVASTGSVVWTTDSDDWSVSLNGNNNEGNPGLFITVGGEVMRVSAISGASSPQTFTVVRSINGVVKSHSSGAAVHVRNPVVVAL